MAPHSKVFQSDKCLWGAQPHLFLTPAYISVKKCQRKIYFAHVVLEGVADGH